MYNTLYVEVFCVDTKAQGVSQAVSRICVEIKKAERRKKNTDKERKTTVMQAKSTGEKPRADRQNQHKYQRENRRSFNLYGRRRTAQGLGLYSGVIVYILTPNVICWCWDIIRGLEYKEKRQAGVQI